MDPCQLPPIKERISKVFLSTNGFTLTEIVRQEKGNPLLEVLQMLRNDVLNGTSTFLHHIYRNRVGITENKLGYLCLDTEQFENTMLEYFRDEDFTRSTSYIRYAAYTRESVGIWNNFIRQNTLDNPDELINHDDLFTGYNTVVNEYNKAILVNSEDYILEDLSRRVTDYNFESFVVTLKNLETRQTSAMTIVNHAHPSFINFYNHANALHLATEDKTGAERNRAWKKYFEFKEKNLLLIDVPLYSGKAAKPRNTIPKDLDYGYGLTIHKLQGSTIRNMFINVLDIAFWEGNRNKPRVNTSWDPYAVEFRNKLLYTAVSRASHLSFLLI